jgi:hypothetical protein
MLLEENIYLYSTFKKYVTNFLNCFKDITMYYIKIEEELFRKKELKKFINFASLVVQKIFLVYF